MSSQASPTPSSGGVLKRMATKTELDTAVASFAKNPLAAGDQKMLSEWRKLAQGFKPDSGASSTSSSSSAPEATTDTTSATGLKKQTSQVGSLVPPLQQQRARGFLVELTSRVRAPVVARAGAKPGTLAVEFPKPNGPVHAKATGLLRLLQAHGGWEQYLTQGERDTVHAYSQQVAPQTDNVYRQLYLDTLYEKAAAYKAFELELQLIAHWQSPDALPLTWTPRGGGAADHLMNDAVNGIAVTLNLPVLLRQDLHIIDRVRGLKPNDANDVNPDYNAASFGSAKTRFDLLNNDEYMTTMKAAGMTKVQMQELHRINLHTLFFTSVDTTTFYRAALVPAGRDQLRPRPGFAQHTYLDTLEMCVDVFEELLAMSDGIANTRGGVAFDRL